MSLTVDSALDELGGTAAVAALLGAPLSTVSTWRGRGFFPARRWPEIVRLAREKGVTHITFEALASLQPGVPEDILTGE